MPPRRWPPVAFGEDVLVVDCDIDTSAPRRGVCNRKLSLCPDVSRQSRYRRSRLSSKPNAGQALRPSFRNGIVVAVSQRLRFVSSIAVISLSLVALLTVASGYVRPPQPNDAREYIFQLSIVALLPMMLVFLATADWRQPVRSARPLAFAVAASAVAFVGLYVLEHYR